MNPSQLPPPDLTSEKPRRRWLGLWGRYDEEMASKQPSRLRLYAIINAAFWGLAVMALLSATNEGDALRLTGLIVCGVIALVPLVIISLY